METNHDPLAALVSSDIKSIDRKKLAELLGPYLLIDQDSKEFAFTAAFDSVAGNDAKVEILLLGAKARALLFSMPDGMLPSEIIATGILAEGSVKTSLKRLFDARKIKKDKEGRYCLPSHLIPVLSKRLTIQ